MEKQLNLNLELNRKGKENLTKIKKKQSETMRGEMSIFSEIERNKDPKTRKARKDIRKYKITNAKNISVSKRN